MDVPLLIDRMGNLVLAVQALFNERCGENGVISREAATGEFLSFLVISNSFLVWGSYSCSRDSERYYLKVDNASTLVHGRG